MDEQSKELIQLFREILKDHLVTLGMLLDKESAEALVEDLHSEKSEQRLFLEDLQSRSMAALNALEDDAPDGSEGMEVNFE